MSEEMIPKDKLIERLAGSLDRATAAALTTAFVEARTAPAVLELLEELQGVSSKAAQGAIEALPELQRRGALESVVPWLDLGVALAGSSGAAATRYFKESPLIIGLLDPAPVRGQVLALALELADSDANVALEFFRRAPALLSVLPADQLPAWAQVGVELARFDYVLGIEFLRQAHAAAAVIPLEQVRAWVGFGMKLITQNSLGKTDYLGTMEFFRTSPAILGEIEGTAVRGLVVETGSMLADRAPQAAIAFLAESPALLRRIPSEAWRTRVLQYGQLVAERDAVAAVEYLRRCPEILGLIGEAADSHSTFEDWFKGGMEILSYSADGARAYFSLETRKALASLEQAMSGVPLRQVARSLKLFAQGLCGVVMTIRALPDPIGGTALPIRPTVSPDGRTLGLPAILRRYPTREQNARLYLVMTAHEAGHLEFGTYELESSKLADLMIGVRSRYRRPDVPPVGARGLDRLFALYPQPGLIRDLWTVLEDARVEYRLQHQYPGLRRDLAELAREAVSTRTLLHGLSVREMVVDTLLLLSTAAPGSVRIPDSIADVVERVWPLCLTVLTLTATAEETIRVADRIYVTLEDMLAAADRESVMPGPSTAETDLGAGPQASEELSGRYRPVTNWAYRGAMNPEMVRDRRGDDEQNEDDAVQHPLHREEQRVPGHGDGASAESPRPRVPASGLSDASRLAGERRSEQRDEGLTPGTASGSAIAPMPAVDDVRQESPPAGRPGERVFFYDEWDGLIQDYRSGWCRVVERGAPEGTADFAEATLAAHGPAVRLLRRYFEGLRPPGLRRVHGQADGEDLDLDSAIRRVADLAAGAEAGERIYIRREKRERDVAAAFLVDLSGSTSRQIDAEGRRVIDVEKEGLVLLYEALEAIGDQYAVYGYSGQGRHHVDFLVLKDFDEPSGRRAAHRLGAVTPLRQNRDGAAIRHAARKLRSRRTKVKLLVLMSDGKPLDDGYADEYSLEDTKMALREARMSGIDPFCITVDREADEYLRRMYGEVRFLVIDHAGALPERLPRVYHALTRS